MEIVIKLPEDDYKRIVKYGMTVFGSDEDIVLLEGALESGVVLPKGHGRLIDADKLGLKTKYYAPRGTEGLLMRCADLQDAPTIIEADKEGEHGKR